MGASRYQTDAPGPVCMRSIASFVALQLWNEKIGRGGNDDFQQAIGLARSASFPIGRKFPQDRLRHQVYVPAVSALKLTSDEGVITQAGYLIGLGDGVHIHAVLRQCLGNISLKRMPEETAGPYQD